MSELLQRLGPNQRRGSKPRCHWIAHGSQAEVAERLTGLIAPWGTVSADDNWLPLGFDDTTEAELHKAESLLTTEHCLTLRNWWFKKFSGGLQKSPSFDIASTCSVKMEDCERPGILLVEAKAHDTELNEEERGKPLESNPTPGRKTNHDHICKALANANPALNRITELEWNISGQDRYQMSNRFGWATALLELGFPVILVYLGFLRADEMSDRGTPLADHDTWEALVKDHGNGVVPKAAWDTAWQREGKCLVPLIRSAEVDYKKPVSEFCVKSAVPGNFSIANQPNSVKVPKKGNLS